MAWWRIAELPTGEPVGFVIPARNNYHPIIAYIGVLPARRGHGYIDDLSPRAPGCWRPRAWSGSGRRPTSATYRWRSPSERLGYVNFERAFNMVWDAEKSEVHR